MGRGSYLGGSTVIGPRSGWFSKPKKKRSKKKRKKAPTGDFGEQPKSEPVELSTEKIEAKSKSKAEAEARKREAKKAKWKRRKLENKRRREETAARNKGIEKALPEELQRPDYRRGRVKRPGSVLSSQLGLKTVQPKLGE